MTDPSDFDAFIREQFALWSRGKEVSQDLPSTGSLDASTCSMFMQSLDPISGDIRMGPNSTFTFGSHRSNQPQKSPYALFSADGSGNVVLHRRYIYLVAAHHYLTRQLGWPTPRVRFYDAPYSLVAYSEGDRPYLIAEARDTQKEAEDLVAKLQSYSDSKAGQRLARLLDGILADKPKLFWVRGPQIDNTFEVHVDGPRLELVGLKELPTWEQLGNP